MKKGLGRGLTSLLSVFENEGEDIAYDLDNDIKDKETKKIKDSNEIKSNEEICLQRIRCQIVQTLCLFEN